MKRNEIKKVYEENGLYDFKLRNTEDLFKVHKVDFKDVDGYEKLDETYREVYEEFIVKLFNSWGPAARSTLMPRGVYLIEDVQFLVEENPKDDYYIVCGKNSNCLLFKYEVKNRNQWFRITKSDDIYTRD